MKKGFLFAAVIAMITLASCTKERIVGGGREGSDTRTVSNFTSVTASGSSNVHITQGASFTVEIKGYENLLPYYESKVVNNKLRLGYREGLTIKKDNIEVYITLPVLNGLAIEGSGNIRTEGNFTATPDFEAIISGSGSIWLSTGSTDNFYSTISGSGDINALGITAKNADVITSGSGNTEITATNNLKIKIAGSGNVYYKGNPQITTDIAGSGRVIPK